VGKKGGEGSSPQHTPLIIIPIRDLTKKRGNTEEGKREERRGKGTQVFPPSF